MNCSVATQEGLAETTGRGLAPVFASRSMNSSRPRQWKSRGSEFVCSMLRQEIPHRTRSEPLCAIILPCSAVTWDLGRTTPH
jgi:hypothetical protein